MPSCARRGEGFTRAHDLISELRNDIDYAYEALELDKQSQFLRRNVG